MISGRLLKREAENRDDNASCQFLEFCFHNIVSICWFHVPYAFHSWKGPIHTIGNSLKRLRGQVPILPGSSYGSKCYESRALRKAHPLLATCNVPSGAHRHFA